MHSWRITKYDPNNRSASGHYFKDEWTSISDVGKEYGDALFTLSRYIKIESLYLDSILIIMSSLGVDYLMASDLEKRITKRHTVLTKEEMSFLKSLKNNMCVPKESIDLLARLVLREFVWCKLVHSNMFVHFGYDYHMYIGSTTPLESELEQIRASGLFVESMPSPYC